MKRKSLQVLPDGVMWKDPYNTETAFGNWQDLRRPEVERRRIKLFAELATLTRRFINEGIALEELLTLEAMGDFSSAIFALEWAELYYQEEARRQKRAAQGYWKCLWDALRGR